MDDDMESAREAQDFPTAKDRMTNFSAEDESYMRLALQVAERALQVGEVPVGCVIVLDNPEESPTASVVVSHGANQVNATRDATRHAEIVAIDRILTGGRSSDALRLPASVLTQSARSGMLPENSPMFNEEMLEHHMQDRWVNQPDSNGDQQWKNSYGWGTGRLLSEQDLSRCRLYVRAKSFFLTYESIGNAYGLMLFVPILFSQYSRSHANHVSCAQLPWRASRLVASFLDAVIRNLVAAVPF